MLTDAFFRRYEEVQIFTDFTERERRFCGQMGQLLTTEVHRRDEKGFKERDKDPAVKGLTEAHDRIARELGVMSLSPTHFEHEVGIGEYRRKTWSRYSIERLITNYFNTAPNEKTSIDLYMKHRLSLVEQSFQIRAEQLAVRRASLIATLSLHSSSLTGEQLLEQIGPQHTWVKFRDSIRGDEAAFESHVKELNERFRQAKIAFSYHNNLIQTSDDSLIEEELERPFWAIVSSPEWANVDLQMKEALDERDRQDRNAVSNAMNALESAIKTISDQKGWTTGNEKGAAHYINNLVKERNGVRFIEVWENDVLIKLFGDIRNAFGHGPAAGQPLPTLRPQQTDWAIDTCMVWIKNLVRRA